MPFWVPQKSQVLRKIHIFSDLLAMSPSPYRQGKDFQVFPRHRIGNSFSFSLDDRGGKVPAPKSGKKRASLSTVKRNARHKKEFLAKKNTPISTVENQADLETNQQATFECDQCDAVL